MVFQAKIVEGNKNPWARLTWVGAGLLFVAMVLLCIDGYQRYGFWTMGFAVLLLVTGALVSRGDVEAVKLSATELVVSIEEIRIGDRVYPLATVSQLEFQVEGYYGMADAYGYAANTTSRRRGTLSGMSNFLNFRVGEQKEEWQFYLPDPQSVQQLGALFKEFYSKRIAFLERNPIDHRTFLFAPVSEEQWKDQMIENGYL